MCLEKHIGEALELPVKEDQKSENMHAPHYQTTPRPAKAGKT